MQAQYNRNMKSAFDFSCWLFGRWNKMLAGSIGYGCFYCSSPLDENVHWCIDHWSIDHCSNEKIHYECWPANCFYIQISHNFFVRSVLCWLLSSLFGTISPNRYRLSFGFIWTCEQCQSYSLYSHKIPLCACELWGISILMFSVNTSFARSAMLNSNVQQQQKNIYKIEMCMSAHKRNARTEHTQFLIKRFHFISQIKQRCAGIRKICFIRYTIRIFMDEQI